MFDSSFAPILVVLALVAVVVGFFRHLISKIVVVLLIEIALFVLFPSLLVKFAQLIGAIRNALS